MNLERDASLSSPILNESYKNTFSESKLEQLVLFLLDSSLLSLRKLGFNMGFILIHWILTWQIL